MMQVDMGRVMARGGDTKLETVLAALHHAPGLGVEIIVDLLQHPLQPRLLLDVILASRQVQDRAFLLQVDKELT